MANKRNKFLKDVARGLLGAIIVLSLAMLAGVCVYGAERAKDADDCYNASCRVYNITRSAAGSGTCFLCDRQGNCYILTNYHVAGKKDAYLQFFADGVAKEVKGAYVTSGFDETRSLDFTILKVSAADADGVILSYVPLLRGDEDDVAEAYASDDAYIMTTAGCPKALYLRNIKGRLRGDGVNNCTFYPTPYGGQSGSGIIERLSDGQPWVVALLTWRNTNYNEGSENWGGMAQPITRVVKALESQASGYEPAGTPVPLPDYAAPCGPFKTPDGPRKIIMPDGVVAVECAQPIAAPLSVELWTIPGCQPCLKAKTEGMPRWQKVGDCIVRDGTVDRITATALGVSQYPTIRLVDAGQQEVKRYIGYNSGIDAAVMAMLKQYNTATAVPVNAVEKPADVQQPAEPAPGVRSSLVFMDAVPTGLLDDCDKFKRNKKAEPSDGKDDAPADDGGKDAALPDSNSGRLFDFNKGDGLIMGQIKAAINDAIADVLSEFTPYIAKAKAAIFWLCFLASLSALLCFSLFKGFFLSVVACLKWAIKKAAASLRNLFDKLLAAMAAGIVKHQKNNADGVDKNGK